MPPKAVKKPTFDFIKEAILALKERGGSSPAAIKAWIAKNTSAKIAPHVLKAAFKSGVSTGKLTKVCVVGCWWAGTWGGGGVAEGGGHGGRVVLRKREGGRKDHSGFTHALDSLTRPAPTHHTNPRTNHQQVKASYKLTEAAKKGPAKKKAVKKATKPKKSAPKKKKSAPKKAAAPAVEGAAPAPVKVKKVSSVV